MMGTDSSLNAAQNIQVVTCMEEEVLRLAKQRGFVGVLTTNTNPLTQVIKGVPAAPKKCQLSYLPN